MNPLSGIVSGRVAMLLQSTPIQPAATPISPRKPWKRGCRKYRGGFASKGMYIIVIVSRRKLGEATKPAREAF